MTFHHKFSENLPFIRLIRFPRSIKAALFHSPLSQQSVSFFLFSQHQSPCKTFLMLYALSYMLPLSSIVPVIIVLCYLVDEIPSGFSIWNVNQQNVVYLFKVIPQYCTAHPVLRVWCVNPLFHLSSIVPVIIVLCYLVDEIPSGFSIWNVNQQNVVYLFKVIPQYCTAHPVLRIWCANI